MAEQKGSFKFEVDYLSDLYRLHPTIELYAIYDKDRYEVKPHDLTQVEIDSASNTPTNMDIPIRVLFEYFGIVDEFGNSKTKFNPPFIKIIKYSEEEWTLAYDKKFKRPRVALLQLKNPPYDDKIDNPWVGKWKEVISENIISIPPNDEHPDEGYLIIAFDEFPDPLIGGC